MTTMINVQKLSKKYKIYHETSAYGTLVETLSNQFKRIFKGDFKKKSFYEEFWALKDVDFSIEEGSRVGIIGRNGAGKSTLLKILSRITEPSSGVVKIRKRVSCLLEVATGFHPELTGRENIYLNGAILGMTRKEIKQKFDEIVAFSGIEKFLDTPVKRFSSGMYTRLGFAIAAHLDPEILIVDEVLAVGDTQFQEKCLKKLGELGSEGRTVIFVSHDIGAVLSLCNTGVYLENGRVKEYGPIEQCANAYMLHCRAHHLSWEGLVGDEHIEFKRVQLVLNSAAREFAYQGEFIRVEVEYEVLKIIPDIAIGIGVWNQRGLLLARAHTHDTLQPAHFFATKGKYKASFTLNSEQLYEGEYLLKLECFANNQKCILNDEIVLKLPIYAKEKNTKNLQREGISLGKNWALH